MFRLPVTHSMVSSPFSFSIMRWLRWIGLLVTLLLTACSLPTRVDVNAQSFIQTSVLPRQVSYTWEILPSQQDPQWSFLLQHDIAPLLHAKGFTLDQKATPTRPAPYALQLSLSTSPSINPLVPRSFGAWPPPPMNWQVPFAGSGCAWDAWGASPFCNFPPDRWWLHTLDLLMRDNHTQSVVYESHAQIDGPWQSIKPLLPALIDAALARYPEADPKLHMVSVSLTLTP